MSNVTIVPRKDTLRKSARVTRRENRVKILSHQMHRGV